MKPPEIIWSEEGKYFGLDYSTRTGIWKNYSFSIRYDYDGDPSKRPECGVYLTIYGSYPEEGRTHPQNVRLQSISCFGPVTAMKAAQNWLNNEFKKFTE